MSLVSALSPAFQWQSGSANLELAVKGSAEVFPPSYTPFLLPLCTAAYAH